MKVLTVVLAIVVSVLVVTNPTTPVHGESSTCLTMPTDVCDGGAD